jgi:hypothetical protein
MVHDGSSRNRGVAGETGKHSGEGLRRIPSHPPPIACQNRRLPMQYVEGLSSEHASRRLVAAANPRLQQNCS